MEKRIRVGIVGYGNMGRGAEQAVTKNHDMELVAIFSRRELPPSPSGVPTIALDKAADWKDKIDVLLLCGGSAQDLKTQTPDLVKNFNVVDSFDTHALIPEHFAAVDKVAQNSGKVGVISVGWDPGFFSLLRTLSQSFLPDGSDYTFWGPGVSQGHSDAIRRIPGVLDAKQYTMPVQLALDKVRSGKRPQLTTRQKHTRECFVVAAQNADKALIEKTIKEMPNYFDEYDTTVTFMEQADFNDKHAKMPHGGFVFRTGSTSEKNNHVIELTLKLDSNPEFASSIMLAYARAAYRLNKEGRKGALTAFDIAPAYLSALSNEDLRKNLL